MRVIIQKSEEAAASSASMLATPMECGIKIQSIVDCKIICYHSYSGQSAHRRVQERGMNREEERSAECHQTPGTPD